VNFETLQSQDYRSSLVQELKNRIEKNSNYSLRAFARDIDLSASYLSQLINGQKCLSPRKATAVLKKLKWPYEKEKRFLSSVLYEHSDAVEDETGPKLTSTDSQQYTNMNLDVFELISRWHFGALLELISLPNSEHSLEWLSDKLDIPLSVADEAVETLIRLGFLKKVATGYKRLTPHLQIENIPSSAIRSFHQESLERAKAAVELQPVSDRFFSSVMIPFKKGRISLVGEQIQKFRDSLNKQESNQAGDSVYQLCISFFQVDSGACHLPTVDELQKANGKTTPCNRE
jgi:uncharacterized protein (TIGR02147 family)